LIFVCWRYEWIDYRRELYMQKYYPEQFVKISLWQFILLWWEVATMTMIESITRLIPWVIKESESRQNESYSLKENMQNLEEPNYTRPENVKWFSVPEVLLNGDSEEISKWRKDNSISL
jgi:tRNA (guanine37-N1)-methyltransferase